MKFAKTIMIQGTASSCGKSLLTAALCRILHRNGSPRNIGIADASGRILGTYLHGLFDSGRIAAGIINALRGRKGLAELDTAVVDRRFALERDIDRLADTARDHLDIQKIYGIIRGAGS